MHQDKSLKLFTKAFKNIGKNWSQFIQELKNNSDVDDQSQIYHEDFVKILDKFNSKLSHDEIMSISRAFPGKLGGSKGVRLNVSRIYDQKFNIILEKLYNQVDWEKIDHDESLKDVYGYLGKTEHYREKVKLYPITEEEFF